MGNTNRDTIAAIAKPDKKASRSCFTIVVQLRSINGKIYSYQKLCLAALSQTAVRMLRQLNHRSEIGFWKYTETSATKAPPVTKIL